VGKPLTAHWTWRHTLSATLILAGVVCLVLSGREQDGWGWLVLSLVLNTSGFVLTRVR
jgi:drug/metabolite transporter (DMT)-like permease